MNDKSQNNVAWLCLKISLVFFWLANMGVMLSGIQPPVIAAVGIIKLYQFSFLFTAWGKWATGAALVALSALYILEKQMLFTLFFQFALSLIIISRHESGGMFFHTTVYTVVFAVQWLAYVQHRINPLFNFEKYRVHYGVQIVAALYMLAGISKLMASGINWVNSGELFSLQVIKNYSFIYFAQGNKAVLNEGMQLANNLLQQRNFIRVLLSASLLLELGCFAALISQRVRRVYALGLLAMHAGIKIIMAIPFGVVAPVMVIFFINPLYYVVRFMQQLKNKTRSST